MAVVGRSLLIFGSRAPVCTGIGASLYGARGGGRAWVDSGRRAMYVLAGMAVIAFVILDVAFISSDFSYNIVASGSSTTTPTFYRAAAIWATQQGSLLLWVLLLSSLVEPGAVPDPPAGARDRALRAGGPVRAVQRSSPASTSCSPTRSRPAPTRPPRAPAWTRCCATRR